MQTSITKPETALEEKKRKNKNQMKNRFHSSFFFVLFCCSFLWMLQMLFRFKLFENYIFYIVVCLFVCLFCVCVKISFPKKQFIFFFLFFFATLIVLLALYVYFFSCYSMRFERQHTQSIRTRKKSEYISNTQENTKLSTMPQ